MVSSTETPKNSKYMEKPKEDWTQAVRQCKIQGIAAFMLQTD